MKWLIAIALPLFVPTAQSFAQSVNSLTLGSLSSPNASSAAPEPQTIRDDAVKGTWELGLTYALVRFRSSQFAATMSGLDTTIGYYVRDHLAVEGSITSAFGSGSADADGKYLFYGAGVKLSAGNRKLQPFVHALVGGVHMFPQTAFSNNGFAAELGGGAERRLGQRIGLQVGVDYICSRLYSSVQNSARATAGISYRF
jgi:hypothetical protein